ncbi:hypothetical protein CF326_g8513 [Tilletia indica]|nr:hypothetical protein CF326_g8513 [Tilletia indica]
MPSSYSPLFLTLTPSTLSYRRRAPSDRFDIQLGGIRDKEHVRPLPLSDSATFLFAQHTLEADHASLSFFGDGSVDIVHKHHKDTAMVNDRPLETAERISLRDGDVIQLGFYESWDGHTELVLALQVHLKDYPAPSSFVQGGEHTTIFIPAPVSVFKHLHSAIKRLEDLSQQLTSTQQQLKEALDRQATHVCTPPRPYGQLVNDLRSPLPNDAVSDCLLPSSSPPSSASPLSSVLNRSLSASSPSSSSASESSTSTSTSHSSPPATSVLTSVLGSAQLPPLPSALAQESTFGSSSTSSTFASFSSSTSRLASSSSPLSSALTLQTATRASPSSSTEASSAQTSLAAASSSCSALSTASVLTSVLGSVDDCPRVAAFSTTPPVLNTIHSQRDTSAPPLISSPPRTTASALAFSSADPAAVETSGQGKLRSASVDCVGATTRGTTSLSRRSIDDVLVKVRQEWLGARAALLGQSRTMKTAEIATSRIFEAYIIERSASQPASIGPAAVISQSAASSRGGTSASALPLLPRELSTEPPAAADPHETQPPSSRTISSSSTACSGPPAMASHIPPPRRRRSVSRQFYHTRPTVHPSSILSDSASQRLHAFMRPLQILLEGCYDVLLAQRPITHTRCSARTGR